MILSDEQIERYSRQIIVPGFGAGTQERLRTARVAIVAAPAAAETAALYLAGAGVGHIAIHPAAEPRTYRRLVGRMNDLDADVAVEIAAKDAEPAPGVGADPVLALLGDAAAAAVAERLFRARRPRSAIVARLDSPGRIAMLPAPPPCPLCADAKLLSAIGDRGANAGVVAMVAVAECLRMLAGVGEMSGPRVIEFTGLATRTAALTRRPSEGVAPARCACETP